MDIRSARGSALADRDTVDQLRRDEPTPAEILQARLEEAGATLMALAVRGVRPAQIRSAHPEVVHEAIEAYGWTEEDMPFAAPSARAITRMDEAFGWIALLTLDPGRPGSGERWSRHGPAMYRRLILSRSYTNPRTGRHVFSWRRLGRVLGTSQETARLWHAQALDRLLGAMNRAGIRLT